MRGRVFSAGECGFGYRESVFKNVLKNQFVVTAVVLRLHRQARPNVRYGAIADTLAELGIDGEPTPQDVSRAVVHIRRSSCPTRPKSATPARSLKTPKSPRPGSTSSKASTPTCPATPCPAA